MVIHIFHSAKSASGKNRSLAMDFRLFIFYFHNNTFKHYLTNFKNCGLFFKVGQIMFKWTFLERENIVESRSGLHLSLPGLDVEIMAIKDW